MINQNIAFESENSNEKSNFSIFEFLKLFKEIIDGMNENIGILVNISKNHKKRIELLEDKVKDLQNK